MQPFPLYDNIFPLVVGRHATGELAWHIPEMYASSVADSVHGVTVQVEDNGHESQDEEIFSNWAPSSPPKVNSFIRNCIVLIKIHI